jgi:hypothetical protein
MPLSRNDGDFPLILSESARKIGFFAASGAGRAL